MYYNLDIVLPCNNVFRLSRTFITWLLRYGDVTFAKSSCYPPTAALVSHVRPANHVIHNLNIQRWWMAITCTLNIAIPVIPTLLSLTGAQQSGSQTLPARPKPGASAWRIRVAAVVHIILSMLSPVLISNVRVTVYPPCFIRSLGDVKYLCMMFVVFYK